MRKPKKYPLNQDGVFDFNTSHTFSSVRHTSCCGACELYNLEDGPLAALAILAAWQSGEVSSYDPDTFEDDGNFKPVVLFTDRVTYRNGQALADYITEHRLGEVSTIQPVRNPNSRAQIQAWLWRINRTRWNSWVRNHVVFENYEND
jgi:hypothetical protein